MSALLTWHDVLADEKQQPYFLNTLATVANERQAGTTIYPPQKDVFNAFRFTELSDVKVVILGQDPYHGPGQAHGLAFSVRPGIATPPSLLNMYKELEGSIPGFTRPQHGYLESWARQGVLLLNTVLTVRAGQAHSHASLGWETFTDKVISLINEHREGVVFFAVGIACPEERRDYRCAAPSRVESPTPVTAFCPSRLFGCNHFVQANEWLAQRGEEPIDWMPVLPAESE
jgi:uracil-DNA glycosylase